MLDSIRQVQAGSSTSDFLARCPAFEAEITLCGCLEMGKHLLMLLLRKPDFKTGA